MKENRTMKPVRKASPVINGLGLPWSVCNSHVPENFIYGLEAVVSVLFTNTRTRWPHNEREIFNTARGVAECSIENFEFIVLPASACICKQNTN